eukprot:GSChrysophyteH1.ASY1.ANO1.2209.1 assembled CDS
MKGLQRPSKAQGQTRTSGSFRLFGVLVILMFVFGLLTINIFHMSKSSDAEDLTATNKPPLKSNPRDSEIEELRERVEAQKNELSSIKRIRQQISRVSSSKDQTNEQKKVRARTGNNEEAAPATLKPTQSLGAKKKAAQISGDNSAQKTLQENHKAASSANEIDETIPGAAANHPILRMSDSEFRDTSVSVMLEKYGGASGGGTCGNDFGSALATRWRAKKANVCIGADDGTAASTDMHSSSIDCYLMRQTRHHGNGDNLCHMRNVAMDMSTFDDPSVTFPVVKKYVDTKHVQKPYVKFPKGFIQGKCLTQPSAGWQASKMPGWNEDLTTGCFQPIDYSDDRSKDIQCDEWIEHKVVLVQRDTFANFFHDSEDFVNLFLAMAILEWKPGDTQVYLTDLYPEGPFWEIWSKAFSWGSGLIDRDHSAGVIPHRVCFKDLAVGIYGPASPITVASWNTPCSHSAVVKAYADFIIRGLELQKYSHYASPTPSRTVVITYMARRASTVWPEKRFCNDKSSFFLCRLWDKFGIRPLQRTIQNDDAVVRALKSMEGRTYKNNAKVVFNDRDYNLLSMTEQIREDLRTDIMIGPHGAGLTHCVFLRDRGIVIELPINGAGANRHFHNLAHWSGHAYIQGPDSNPVSVEALTSLVHNAVEKVDLSRY